ncbi:uncharacterized protein LOC144914721 [Branchiostoma floridae x Branchiostoma belcheri]
MTLATTSAATAVTMAMPTPSSTQDGSEERRINSYLFDDPRKKSRNYLDTHKNIEKKRRDRINSSLTALKSIIPECKAYGKKKLDKAEILEMTLSYLDKIHSSGFTLKKEEQQTPGNWAKQLMQWVHQEKKNFHTVDEFVNALLTHLQTCVVSGSFAPVDLKGMLQGTSGQDTPLSQSVVTCQAQPVVTSNVNTAGVVSTSSQSQVTAISSLSQSPACTVTSATSGNQQNGLMRARPPPPPNITPAIFLQATSFQARLRAQAASHVSSAPTMQQQVFPSAAIILQPQQQQQQQAMTPQQVINVAQPIDLTQQCSKQRDVLDLRMTSQGREQLVASNQCIQRLQQLIDQHSMQEQSLMQVQPPNVQMPNAVPYVESTTSQPPAYTQNMGGNLQSNDLSFINSSSQAYILAELPAGVLLQDRMLGSVGEMLSDGTAMDTVPTVPSNDSDASYHNPEQLQVPGIGESPVTEFVDPSTLQVSAVVDDSALMGTPDLPSWSNSPISALEQAPT